jgi:glycine/D-amino acid oxidase-like deaminating enzyme
VTESSTTSPLLDTSALTDAKPSSLWLDLPDRPPESAPLVAKESCDLLIVGGGFTGLWTALQAKERDPQRDVVLIDRGRSPSGASGQNGGFLLGSLVDWFDLPRFPGQEDELVRLGQENLREFQEALNRYDIDCDLEANGWVVAAHEPEQLPELKRVKEVGEAAGLESILLDREEAQAELHSPLLLGAVYQPGAVCLVHPVKIATGLRRACETLGVRIYESTPATSLERVGAVMEVRTPQGSASAPMVALATFAHPSLLTSLRKWRVPLYQHILATEPLSAAQLDTLGWKRRQGFLDLDFFYHYTRLTADNRLLWGYMDGTLYPNRRVGPECEQDMSVFTRMLGDFARHYPQLEGVRFTHRWGGALDLNSRLAPIFGTSYDGRVAYANGYMPGVGASRVGGSVMLDLLGGDRSSPYLRLPLLTGRGAHGRPSLRPYPPEPFLSIGMNAVRRGLDKERQTGTRGLALQALNRIGYHF